jgi:hypothetical protein|tara:strand:- start:202 stop:393 length:192 start_codon:yes stop_codon:yes gene_type:complete
MPLPELVSTTTHGGTVHKYSIPGGRSTFDRYLACFLGSCKFCTDHGEALDYVYSLQDKMMTKC